MPTPRRIPSRLAAGASVAVLCLGPAIASPALAAVHHKTKHHKTKHHAKKSKSLTMDQARSAALKSAAPLILDPADQPSVTGCTAVAGPGYKCDLSMHAAQSASVCHWSVVVQNTAGVADVVSYSHIDCAG